MRKLKIMTAVAVCLIVSLLSGCTIVNNTTIATVNGEKVSESEFKIYFAQIQYSMLDQAGIQNPEDIDTFWETTEIEGKKAIDIAKERALEAAASTALMQSKAAELDVKLTAEEEAIIDEQIGKVISNSGGKSAFEEELKLMDATLSDYEKWIKKGQLAYKVEDHLKSLDENKVSEEEAGESIKNTYIKAKHILISKVDVETQQPLDPDASAAAKEKANSILKQLEGGANFDVLMAENSEDPGLETNPDGYEFGKGQMVEEFETAAYALEVGEISDIVETSYGYHIIKREPFNVTAETLAEYTATEQEILSAKKIEGIIEKWQSEAHIEVNESAMEKLQPLDLN